MLRPYLRVFLPKQHSKYTLVYENICNVRVDNINRAFGIWTSHSFVINANTNNHKDLEDQDHEWYAIVPMGDFEGVDACFPELGVKIECPPST